jgi:hypothetical protein
MPIVPKTPEGMIGLQKDIIRMLEAALKIYAPDDPALVKLDKIRDSFRKPAA